MHMITCAHCCKNLGLLLPFLLNMHISAATQVVTQPIGILARTYQTSGPLPFPIQPPPPIHQPYPLPNTPLQEVNYICAQWDPDEYASTAPFDTNYPTTEVILTKPQHFVRLLSGPQSSSNGAWIMRSEYVRGRTPNELRDIFALPMPPTAIVSVTMPASPDPATGKDYVLWTGIAAPIRAPGFDWGDGGSVQNRLVADFAGTHYFPNYRFTSSDTRYHRQPIGTVTLSYKPLAGCGNTLSVANYLDTYVPTAYSDLEDVYTALDDLNYVGYGSKPLQHALNQISPARYDTLSYIAFRDAVIIGSSMLEWQLFKSWENRWYGPCKTGRKDCSKPYLWLQVVGQTDKNTKHGGSDDFGCSTGGIVGCCDWQVRPDCVVGINMAALGNSFHWFNYDGNGHCGQADIGIYANYFPAWFFINAFLQGGLHGSSTSRTIAFEGINRHACSRQFGEDFALHAQTGLNVLHDLIPYARISYFFTRENKFKEHGADSLNLFVHPFTTNTIRIQIGMEFNHVFEVSDNTKIMPQIQLAWLKDLFIKNRTVAAHLATIGGCFDTKGMCEIPDHFVCGAGLNLLLRDCLTIFMRYDAEVLSHRTINTAKLGLRMTF